MSTPNPQQPGPIAQQLVKMQANGQQPPVGAANSLHSSQGKAQKRTAQWTGFAGKTLWDWLNLLGAAVLIPLVIAAATIGFGWQQNQLAQKQHDSDQRIAKQQHESDQAIALDQQRQAVLQICEDNIKDLLLTKGLHTSKLGDGVRSVARAETLAALRQLDGDRKGLLIHFLSEADLIIPQPNGDVIIPLQGADLHGADLRDANLYGANLSKADLSGVDLSMADLSEAYLYEATLRGATLIGTDLFEATLHGANLYKANLHRANLHRANLYEANLYKANLREADLSKATISLQQLQQASSLQGATMPDGSTHP